MTLILGIDPGSRCTGYGIISSEQQKLRWVAHGQINTSSDVFSERLNNIFQTLSEIISTYQPQQMAIEQVFMHKNAQAALKLGQARGAAIVAGANHGLAVFEYSARQVKQAVVGYGAADKAQVQQMIKIILRLPQAPLADAADALAIALCHCHSQPISRKLGRVPAKVCAGVEA